MYSVSDDAALPAPGCPIRKSSAHSLLSGSPKLIAASHVLHRLLAPRHPPCALSSLTNIAELPRCALDPDYSLPVCSCQRPNDEPDFRLDPCCLPLADTTHPTAKGDGADRNRTDGLRLARAALSHLSYSPSPPDRARSQRWA
jgi:hypothetical protein